MKKFGVISEMQLLANGSELMKNVYTYDKVDNILSLTNSETSHSYTYDGMNRLVEAHGSSKGQTYQLNMDYDLMGNILRKNQVSSNLNVSHDLIYEYGGAKPNAAKKIGNKLYTYDVNGNPTFVEDGDKYRRMIWDEDNRLQLVDDNKYISRYVYDHTGERVVKTHGESSEVLINGAAVGRLTANENTNWYVSPYFTVGKNGREFTKHYYAGSQRVASKLGNGHFNNAFRHGVFGLTAGTVDYIDRMRQLQGVKQQVYSKLPPGVPHAKGIYAEPEQSGYAYPDGGTPENNFVPAGYPRKPISMYERDRDKAPGVPVIYGESVTNETASGGFGFESEPALEVNVFFYHSDHLGSTAYVTTGAGKVSQFVAYLPFGETLVEEHSATRDMPYLFNAKERDSETGLYYYGARYYDPQVALWLGCDPLRDKYPHLSVYHYCSNNPIMFVDPDGRETRVAQNDDGTYRVIGGELNKDRNIYVYTQDKDGNYTVRGNSIGISSSTTSFYNSDANGGKGAWAVGSIINPNDQSGLNFLDNIIGNNPPMFNDYIANAGNGEKYDFKTTNGTDKPIAGIDEYRGMPVGGNKNTGVVTYSSARDIGNMAAGYVAGANGMSWEASRIAFDAYQSKVSGRPTIEGISTRNAEYYGWSAGSNIRNNTPTQKANNLLRSIWNLITK